MSIRKYQPEQIGTVLRQIEVHMANGEDRLRKEGGVRPIGEILQPRAGIGIHTRSASRSTFVSILFRKPFICRAERTGISSMRSP